MLKEINISNFVITEKVNIELINDFTSITGETGAGKSILLKALSILMGERVSSDVIKHGETKAEISATFDISNVKEIKEKLKELEILNEEDENELLIRKVITKSGKKTFLNDIKVGINLIKEITCDLISMHNQKEHLSILKKDYQLSLLDSYIKKDEIKNKMIESFNNITKKEKKLKEKIEKREKNKERVDIINFKLNKLKELNLKKGEYKELETKNNEIKNAADYRNGLSECFEILFENENSVLSLLNRVNNILPETESMTNTKDLIDQSMINITETKKDISSFLDNLDFDEVEILEIEEKISEINSVCKSMNIFPEEILDKIQELENELSELEFSDDDISLLEEEIKNNKEKYHENAEKISDYRNASKKDLKNNVNNYLKKLNIRENAFDIKIISNKEKISLNGYDEVEFVFSPNAGSPFSNLSKIASGGELSRVSLAIQLSLSNKINFNTMIFDEIDTGVGGQTAAEIGIMLKELGKNTQVICITHQPQVASKAKMHILINKYEKDNKTFHEMNYINGEKRVKEIARMLSSEKETKESFNYAKVLLEE